MVNKVRGFILQASYRVVPHAGGRRIPVVHLYGRLETGDTFLVRDDRQRPHFFIPAAAAERVAGLQGPEPRRSNKRSFGGSRVSMIEVDTPPEVPDIRDRLHAAGIETFEADVRFAMRYLIERGIKGGCEIEGEASAGAGIAWEFNNPSLRPAAVVRHRDQSQERAAAGDLDVRTRDRRSPDRRRQRSCDAAARTPLRRRILRVGCLLQTPAAFRS
jgi:DNA polymerase-2